MVQELENLEEVLFAGHSGVVAKLLEVCVRCGEHQSSLLLNLLKCFHIEGSPEKCVPLFLTLTTVEAHSAQVSRREGKRRLCIFQTVKNCGMCVHLFVPAS